MGLEKLEQPVQENCSAGQVVKSQIVDGYSSWTRYQTVSQKIYAPESIPSSLDFLHSMNLQGLPGGRAKSYGDCCINNDGLLISSKQLNRILSTNWNSGVIVCEPGVTWSEILEESLSNGWAPALSPSTQHVTVGGAVANDVHGRNQHRVGNFGNFVRSFDLLRSDGVLYRCSPSENSDLFYATLGGIGLTGLVTRIELRLVPSSSGFLVTTKRFRSLREGLEICQSSESQFEYLTLWFDMTQRSSDSLKGFIVMANPDKSQSPRKFRPQQDINNLQRGINIVNPLTSKLLNIAYLLKTRNSTSRVPFESYLYTLDAVAGWNRFLGAKGFRQSQFVVPRAEEKQVYKIMDLILKSGELCFLGIMKNFGDIRSGGLLSFPMRGFSFALDFANRGESTVSLLKQINRMTVDCGGRLYLAKDSTMSREDFERSYPNWEAFKKWKDASFSSTLWSRISGD